MNVGLTIKALLSPQGTCLISRLINGGLIRERGGGASNLKTPFSSQNSFCRKFPKRGGGGYYKNQLPNGWLIREGGLNRVLQHFKNGLSSQKPDMVSYPS